jgi:hypothetical protein
MVLADWRFPSEIVSAIREHYLTSSADYENRNAVLLNLSGRIVSDAGHTLPGDRRFLDLTPKKMEALGINEDGYRRASQRAGEMFERLRSSLS